MNRTLRLSKSGVEYLDRSWGIWSGCQNLQNGKCSVKACWAKGLALHYPKIYPNGFEPTFYPEAIDSPKHLKKPSIISVGWVGDVIGYCDSHSIAKENIFKTIEQCPQHKFLFLTKNPEKLFTWGSFPDNCWVGQTLTGLEPDFYKRMNLFEDIQATVKFISFEPLLAEVGWPNRFPSNFLFQGVADWVIIGSQTKPNVYPKIEWVQEIAQACDKAGIPVFLKDNLLELVNYHSPETDFAFNKDGYYRQEMPVADKT